MKRFVFLTATLFCLLSITQNIQTQSFLNDVITDDVWGDASSRPPNMSELVKLYT
jgi:hypothetical protein